MAPLQYQLDNLDGLDESISKLYIEKDGKFILDVTGQDKPGDNDRIPLSRLNQEIEKRKASEAQLKELADQLTEEVDESKRAIIPDLPPGAKISWLRTAFKMGFFNEKETPPIDPKKPGNNPPASFENMTPAEKIKAGLKNLKNK